MGFLKDLWHLPRMVQKNDVGVQWAEWDVGRLEKRIALLEDRLCAMDESNRALKRVQETLVAYIRSQGYLQGLEAVGNTVAGGDAVLIEGLLGGVDGMFGKFMQIKRDEK